MNAASPGPHAEVYWRVGARPPQGPGRLHRATEARATMTPSVPSGVEVEAVWTPSSDDGRYSALLRLIFDHHPEHERESAPTEPLDDRTSPVGEPREVCCVWPPG